MSSKVNLTTKEVEQTYGVSIAKLKRLRRDGEGPSYIKYSGRPGARGGRIVYPRAEIALWLESRMVRPTSAAQR